MNIPIKEFKTVKNSSDIAEVMRGVYALLNEEDSHKEVFYVIGLNSQNTILFIDLVTFGTVNRASPTIRECLRQAIVKNAVSIIAIHNHPSGDTTPSPEDRSFTQNLKQACQVIEIKILDHIILGNGYYSFSDAGAM